MQQQQQYMPFGWPMVPFVPTLPTMGIDDIDIINYTSGGPTGPTGPSGPPGPAGNPSPVQVTEVSTPTYTALSSDYLLCINHAGQVVITLPTGILGTVYIVKDCDGNASPTSPIIVQGTLQNVDIGTATINTSFGSLTLVFTGTSWSIV